MKIYVADDFMRDGVSFGFEPREGEWIAPLEFNVTKPPEGLTRRPAFTLRSNEVQQIMNELWRIGYRPNNGEGSSAQIEALKYHLEDMRKLAFIRK